MKASYLALCLSVVLMVTMPGCARAMQDTTGFASLDSATVPAGFDDTWQTTKTVLRELELDIYTRDTRGEFVAFSRMKRRMRVLTPHRAKITVVVEELSPESSRVSVETVHQVYGVTPLTYPDWHDRGTADNEYAVMILDALKARLS